MIVARILLLHLLVIFVSPALWAQFNTAEIIGSIKDMSGAVLPGATVTAIHNATGFRSELLTDSKGEFLLPNLPVGEYTVSAEYQGFKKVSRAIVLVIGQELRLDFALEVGSVSEEVTVLETDVPLLQTGNAEVSEVIENYRSVNLPLNGRQFMDLALLSDGVVKPPSGTRGSAMQ